MYQQHCPNIGAEVPTKTIIAEAINTIVAVNNASSRERILSSSVYIFV